MEEDCERRLGREEVAAGKQGTRGGDSEKQGLKVGNTGSKGSRGDDLCHQGEGKSKQGRPSFASLVRGRDLFSSDEADGREDQVREMAERWAKLNAGAGEEGGSQPLGGHELCPEIHFTAETVLEISKPWWGCLIMKVLGRRVSYQFLSERLRAMWKPKGELKLIGLGADFFLVHLGDWQDRDTILNEGPWAVFGHHLSVREWTPAFIPHEATVDRAVVWARIPGLPLEYYNSSYLTTIGNRLGRTVKLDADTQSSVKGRYARICLELNLQRSLIGHFKLNGHLFNVEYEGLQLLCFGCGKVGHRREGCTARKAATDSDGGKIGREAEQYKAQDPKGGEEAGKPASSSSMQAGIGEGKLGAISRAKGEDEHHGPWMTVVHCRRPKGDGRRLGS